MNTDENIYRQKITLQNYTDHYQSTLNDTFVYKRLLLKIRITCLKIPLSVHNSTFRKHTIFLLSWS